MIRTLQVGALALLFVAYTDLQAGWRDWLPGSLGGTEKSSASGSSATTGLSNQEIVNGLKEALDKGTSYAVKSLGAENGFLNNAQVRIPMPDSLQKVDRTLRSLGAGKYVDEFVGTMNHAAEKAVVEAAPIFANAIRSMTIEDGLNILKGPDNAATKYFQTKTRDQLQQKMLPITKQATEQAGVTRSYKTMVGKMGFASSLVSEDAKDIDQYITNKALDGLYLMIAEEEKKIRENPVARTTDILKKVFSSVGK